MRGETPKRTYPVDRKLEQKEQRRIERAAEGQIRAREGRKDLDLERMVPGPQPVDSRDHC